MADVQEGLVFREGIGIACNGLGARDEGAMRSEVPGLFRTHAEPGAQLPTLNERRDDIPLLMEAFLRRYGTQYGRAVPGFTPRAVQALLQYRVVSQGAARGALQRRRGRTRSRPG